ncbi:hypothetical protein EYZ11_006255 [Aspergillus tanneri]|uniref:Uncharacterized protein n=1 Tax=Aspergillus tanneri TaxID=1220188 RepID=A0A4S3JGA9_9EURO|nr:hypothetical protein EYZ11_006255 [Aspergillus tanneri]
MSLNSIVPGIVHSAAPLTPVLKLGAPQCKFQNPSINVVASSTLSQGNG